MPSVTIPFHGLSRGTSVSQSTVTLTFGFSIHVMCGGENGGERPYESLKNMSIDSVNETG